MKEWVDESTEQRCVLCFDESALRILSKVHGVPLHTNVRFKLMVWVDA